VEFSDFHDVGVYEDGHQDDEAGIYGGDSAPDPWAARDKAFAAHTALAEAIERINADFGRRARLYVEQQKRNPGPVRPELAALMSERDSKVRELTRAHQRAQALEWATRDRPGRIASAHERQVERAAAHAFARDLGRGRFLRDEPADAGRDVRDAWIW
jgi:hypothetical protein